MPLVYNISKTDNFHTHHARALCAVSRMRRTDWLLNGDTLINERLTCKDSLHVSWLKLKHLCIVLNSCLSFELEYIIICYPYVFIPQAVRPYIVRNDLSACCAHEKKRAVTSPHKC